jgi:hypothetical protein
MVVDMNIQLGKVAALVALVAAVLVPIAPEALGPQALPIKDIPEETVEADHRMEAEVVVALLVLAQAPLEATLVMAERLCQIVLLGLLFITLVAVERVLDMSLELVLLVLEGALLQPLKKAEPQMVPAIT